MKQTMVVVNGPPRSGKDTAVEYLRNHLQSLQVMTSAYSSIDPVREMLRGAGFTVDDKTPAMRKLLFDVGDATETFNQFRTRGCAQHARDFAWNYPRGRLVVVFIHIREPALIDRLEAMVEPDWRFVRIMVRGSREESVDSNHADRLAHTMRSDMTIHNNGTLEELDVQCRQVANWLSDNTGTVDVDYRPIVGPMNLSGPAIDRDRAVKEEPYYGPGD